MKTLWRMIVFGLSILWGTGLVCAQTETLRFEAEQGILNGVNIATTAAGFSGSGYVRGFSDGSERVAWEFDSVGGLYRLKIGFRTPGGPKGFVGFLNEGGVEGVFPSNSAFSEFDAGLVLLKAGSNRFAIGGGWNFYEIDYVVFEKTAGFEPPLKVLPSLVDPLASEEARELMRTLCAVYGKTTLSGQQDIDELAKVEQVSGKRPAILGGDLIEYSPSRLENGSNPNGHTEALIEHHAAGHVITLAWHWNAPTDLYDTEENRWWSGFYTRATSFDVATALEDPDGENYALMLRDIDAIAVELKKLEAAKVPVLWRPLHESEGAWFWWGAKGAEPFRELWRLLFDRLTHHHDLHNLIWVLTSEDADWYPGDEYVDIIGVDAYPEFEGSLLARNWEALKERFDGKKLIALTEVGKVPYIAEMQSIGIWWSYFMSWNNELGIEGMSDPDKARSIYRSEEVITLDEYSEVDEDGDGLSLLLESAWRTSDQLKDSNGDGVEDGRAIRLGFSPWEELKAYDRLARQGWGNLEIRDLSGAYVSSAGFRMEPWIVGSEGTHFSLRVSSDLQQWDTEGLQPAMTRIDANDQLGVAVVRSEERRYFQVIGESMETE